MFKTIYGHLKQHGYDVYSIGQHRGLCEVPYIVIKNMGVGQTPNNKLLKDLINLYVYFPLGAYTKAESYAKDIEECMSKLPGIKPHYDSTPIIIDDEKRAYLVRLSYQNIKQRRY